MNCENNLPEGWAATAINEVFKLNPRKVPADALDSDAPVTFVPMPAVDADIGAITRFETREFAAVRKGYTSFLEDDVIVAKITPCMENGKAAIARGLTNGHGFGSSEFHVLRSTGSTLPEYVYHFVRQEAFRSEAMSHMTGSVGQKRVPPSFLGESMLPLPPLAEQERIVAKVEALLERVNQARERLARVPDLLKRFRQSVLAAACSGQLTADWREENPDQESPTVLLERITAETEQLVIEKTIRKPKPLLPLQPAELPFQLPQHWKWIQAQDTCEPNGIITYGILKPVWVADGVPTVRIKDMKNGRIVVDDVVQCSPERAAKFSKTSLKTGDLLVAKDGATLGKTAFVPKSLDGGNVTQHVLRFPISEHLSRHFVRLFVDSSDGQAWMRGKTKGVALPGVNVGDFRRMPVPLPPLSEQHEIVRRVKSLFEIANQIEQRISTATNQTKKITQSILAKAFAGELVETEAGLARREARDYEPASALLERIAAERAVETSNGKPQKKKSKKAVKK